MNDESLEQATGSPPALPRHTTPTWEVELLISGVAVFAMLQLPGLLDDAVFALRPRFSQAWTWPVVSFYLYAKTAAVILAATFILHLTLRARWIALVGLLSVHPRGIDWEKLRLGRVALEVERARVGESSDILERADNLASVVFATGVSVAVLLLIVSLVAVLGLGAATLAGVTPNPDAMMVVFVVLFVPLFAAQMLDRQAPRFLERHPRLESALRRMLQVYARFGIGAAQSPAMAILASNAGRRKIALTSVGIMLVAISIVAASYVVMRDRGTGLGSYALFPEVGPDTANALVPSHYDDQRDPARDPPDPFIPSMVAGTPFLPLVVPYVPVRDEPAARERCPAADASLDAVASNAAALACLQSLYPLTLDGDPLDIRYEIGSDARTARPSLVAMIDLRELARGRHELVISVPPKIDPDGKESPEARMHRIPFWR